MGYNSLNQIKTVVLCIYVSVSFLFITTVRVLSKQGSAIILDRIVLLNYVLNSIRECKELRLLPGRVTVHQLYTIRIHSFISKTKGKFEEKPNRKNSQSVIYYTWFILHAFLIYTSFPWKIVVWLEGFFSIENIISRTKSENRIHIVNLARSNILAEIVTYEWSDPKSISLPRVKMYPDEK